MDESRFTLKSGRHVQAAPCLEVQAFNFGAPAENGPGLARFLHAFIDAFGDQLRFYRTGDMKRYRPFAPKVLDGPNHWFAEPALLNNLLGFMAHAGETERDVVPPAIKLTLMGNLQEPCAVLRMMLPPALGDAPDAVLALVSDALALFPFKSGHCGYSFMWEGTDPSLEEDVCDWAAPLLLRHPGLGYGEPVTLSNAADSGVVAVSWLTFLGPEWVQALGGAAALAARAPAEVSVRPLGQGGVMLRAGDAPQLGDVNRQDLLPAYRAVGHLVEPVRSPDDELDDLDIMGMTDEQAHDWLLRFFV